MTTSTLVTMRDAAWPSSVEPTTAAELIYAGGDTPNPMQDLSTARYRVPCWVRSNPQQVSPNTDAVAFATWLHDNNVPLGTVTVLDLEMAVDPAYVNVYGSVIHSFGYYVWPYGSTSTLFQNPALDGYFAADPTGVEHLYPNTVATQYYAAGAYDLTVIAPGAPLWDTQPPPPSTKKEVHMFVAQFGQDGQPGSGIVLVRECGKPVQIDPADIAAWLAVCGQQKAAGPFTLTQLQAFS